MTLKIIQPIDTVMGSDFVGQFAKNAIDAVSYKGHVYAAPDINGNHLMLLYNKKLVTGAPPATTDDLMTQAKSLTNTSKNQFGIVFNENEAFWLMPWLGGFGGAVFDSNTKPTLNTQAMIDALAFERSLKTSGRRPSTADYNKADSLFKSGNAAFLINGDWSLSGYKTQLGSNLGIAPLPQVSKTGTWAAPYTASRGYSINCRRQRRQARRGQDLPPLHLAGIGKRQSCSPRQHPGQLRRCQRPNGQERPAPRRLLGRLGARCSAADRP